VPLLQKLSGFAGFGLSIKRNRGFTLACLLGSQLEYFFEVVVQRQSSSASRRPGQRAAMRGRLLWTTLIFL
jgi:hypothetical protein